MLLRGCGIHMLLMSLKDILFLKIGDQVVVTWRSFIREFGSLLADLTVTVIDVILLANHNCV